MFQEFEMQESILHKTNARDVFNLPRLKEAGEAVSLNLEREEEERPQRQAEAKESTKVISSWDSQGALLKPDPKEQCLSASKANRTIAPLRVLGPKSYRVGMQTVIGPNCSKQSNANLKP